MLALHHHWNDSDDEDADDLEFGVRDTTPRAGCGLSTGSSTESRHYSNATQSDDDINEDDSNEDMDEESYDSDKDSLRRAARTMSSGDYMAQK